MKNFKDFLKKLTDLELENLKQALYQENYKREKEKLIKENKCLNCEGIGYLGSELDRYLCPSCKGTGKYLK